MKRLLLLLALAGAGVLATAGLAAAAPGDPFQFKGFINGEEVPGGIENPSSLAVNYQSGNLLIYNQGRVVQVDPASGEPVDFAGPGAPSFVPGGGNLILVDNTGGATQGNIYVFDTQGCCGSGELFWSYDEDGNPIGSNPHEFTSATGISIQHAGVAPDGNIWIFGQDVNTGEFVVVKVTPAGTLVPGSRESFEPFGNPSVFDRLGHLYAPGVESFLRFDGTDGFANEGETGLVRKEGFYFNQGESLAIDPSTEDVYERTREPERPSRERVIGIHYSDPLVPSTPFEALTENGGSGPMAFSGDGQTLFLSENSRIGIFRREPPSAPFALGSLTVDAIRTNRAAIHGQLTSGGAESSYFFEYGTTTSYGSSTAPVKVPLGYYPVQIDGAVEGLAPATTYHVRMVAVNSAGSTPGPDFEFTTYPFPVGGGEDPCPNALARKETSAQALPDCRAFELVSARDTGGYDVESSLAPGQEPFPGYPEADGRALYATHSGAVPGPWKATNRGPDPYLATRGEEGWRTQYAGLPSDLAAATGPFSSVLGEADSNLDSFAFAGPGLCSPCFSSGLETGIPVRLADGSLTQGMAGSLDPGAASAEPEGAVARSFSADGRHLVFASKYAFEPGANSGGDLTVYDRDLATRTTQIVSTDDTGATLSGTVSELGMSDDGSRIVVGRGLGSDPAGNEYVHPYMHLGGSPQSADLAPGTTSGVLFAGMTGDGSKAFFTSVDKLLPGDTDASADLYEAAVSTSGDVTLSLVTGTNSNACEPVENSAGPHWNSTGTGANCDAVAIGGGGGVAASSGAVYFLSPEQLDGTAGTANQPNLYLAEPGGSPRFVATLEADNPLVLDSVADAATRRSGDFETSSNGRFAVFLSARELTGVHTFDVLEVFRYDADGPALDCVSCDETGSSDGSLAADAELAPEGLSLIEDGRVFFSSPLALVLNDANGRRDVYSWSGSGAQLISSGLGPFDSKLLSVTVDGVDAFFFTRDDLAPGEDENGALARLYDAREGGGFFRLPASVPCAASDECHGPGTVPPPPPSIKSSGQTTPGNYLVCKKGKVKRHGKCVNKAKKKHAKKHSKNHAKKGKGKRHA